MSKPISRRTMLRVLTAAGGALAVMPVVGCGGGGADCSDLTGFDTSTRTALHYVAASANPANVCSNCTLYTAGANGCGTCQAFPGPVSPGGTCNSFVART